MDPIELVTLVINIYIGSRTIYCFCQFYLLYQLLSLASHLFSNINYYSVFGHSGQEAQDIIYINWLSMARAGLLALEFYSPDTKSWRQVCTYNPLLSLCRCDINV